MTIDMLRAQFEGCSIRKFPGAGLDRLYLNMDSIENREHTRATSLESAITRLSRSSAPVVKTHCLREDLLSKKQRFFKNLEFRIIYLVRDVRDVMCSLHAYEQEFNPMAKVSLPKFIRQVDSKGLSRIEQWAAHVRSWNSGGEVLVVQFESLREQTELELVRISNFLGISPRMNSPLLPRPWKSRLLCTLVGRLSTAPKATTVMGRPRGVELVRWRDVFSVNDFDYIYEQAGEVMDFLGYEKS